MQALGTLVSMVFVALWDFGNLPLPNRIIEIPNSTHVTTQNNRSLLDVILIVFQTSVVITRQFRHLSRSWYMWHGIMSSHLDFDVTMIYISQVEVVLRTIAWWTSTPTKDFRDRSSSGFQSEMSPFIKQLSKCETNLSPFRYLLFQYKGSKSFLKIIIWTVQI